eukprot:2995118-Rhodomonas_salina.1
MDEDRVIQQGYGWVQDDTSDDFSSSSQEDKQDESANQLDKVAASPESDGAEIAGESVPH